jgi:beta-N-acetylhexosaminidase
MSTSSSYFLVIVVILVGVLFLTDAWERLLLSIPKEASAPLENSVQMEAKNLIKEKVDAFSLDQKIGQMMMVSISGKSLSGETLEWLKSRHIGGVILLGPNVESEDQVKELIESIQQEARKPGDPKLFIAVDQEGGIVSRFRFLETQIAQKDIKTSSEAFLIGIERAKELRALGVNMNFSPVLDVASSTDDFIYSRAFNGDSTTVQTLGSALARGYKQGGIISVAKHFPGHGGTEADSHKTLPTLKGDSREWSDNLSPFISAIENNVPIIMSGHLKVLSQDDKYPASLSRKIITGILREELGYEGLIITDDLGMGAISNNYKLTEAIVLAVAAGNDIILVVRNQEDHDEIFKALRRAVEVGIISKERIDESLLRILSLKEKI